MKAKSRCAWANGDPLMEQYHDREWGVPVLDDRRLFEFLILDAMQAGLSWRTILHKRENFRRAFAQFEPARVARFDRRSVTRLLHDAGIVRNRLKIEASIQNARAVVAVQREYGAFAPYLWSLAGTPASGRKLRTLKEIPAQTDASRRMSKALRDRGFRFVGPTICYAFMQAAGMVNDHVAGCYRQREVADLQKRARASLPNHRH